MSAPLAVLGGMFDPVHKGHVAAANFALEFLQAERLKMIPCRVPNHKSMPATDAEHRLAMLEIATANFSRIEIDSIELRRDRVSYTVETLSELRRDHANLVFVLGADSFNSLPEWHEWQRLFDLTHFLVLSRPGSALSDATLEKVKGRSRLVTDRAELFANGSGNIIHCDDFHYDMASSEIRNTLVNGGDVTAQLDASVVQYIVDHGLYRH